mgnify:CR=1 FL=1
MLIKREISVKELYLSYLEKIKKEDDFFGSFLYLNFENEKEIERAQKMIDEGKAEILTGIPIAVKDNILVEGMPATAASKILENFLAPYDATCIRKLKEKGCLIIGKTNLDEFAMGSSTENSAFKKTRNPYDPERVPGGSSGGSAVAVSKDFVPIALGSDTGGSIRQPASFCGIVGFKPTYGLVSRYGLISMASSLDQIGPFAKEVEDAKILFLNIMGPDKMDATTLKSFNFKEIRKEKFKIGIPKEYFFEEGLDPRIKDLIFKRLDEAKNLIEIEEISLPYSKFALECYYIVMSSEVSANLARYDGIRYGPRKENDDIFKVYSETRNLFGPEVKRRIFLGTFVLSHGYYEAYYIQALKLRRKIQEDFIKSFEKVDFIITPTSPTLPFKFGEKQDPISMYLSDIYTVSINLAGIPAISLNGGFIDGLPVGIQIIGNHFSDLAIFDFAQKLEEIWSFHK